VYGVFAVPKHNLLFWPSYCEVSVNKQRGFEVTYFFSVSCMSTKRKSPKMVAAGKQAWKTRMANLRKRRRKSFRKSKGQVVGFYKDHGKTKPITKSVAQLKRKKVVAGGRKFGGVTPKKWGQQAKASGHVKAGALKKYGYDANNAAELRHMDLVKCVNAEGFNVCRSRVQFLVNITKDDTKLDRIYKQDLAFLDGMRKERSERWKKVLGGAAKTKHRSGYKVVATYASKSTPGKKYQVVRGPKGGLSCNCPSWIFKKRDQPTRTCKHVQDYESKHKK